MGAWDSAFDRECHDLIKGVCSAEAAAGERTRAWQQLILRIGPCIEEWAARSPLLRRCSLASEDEVRSVLVAVLARLSHNGYRNLACYLARQPAPTDTGDGGEPEIAVVDELSRAVRLCEANDGEPGAGAGDDSVEVTGGAAQRDGTPFRGWLIQLVRFAIKDHVRRRLGWSDTARARFVVEPATGAPCASLVAAVRALDGVLGAELEDGALEVTYLPGSVRVDRLTRAIEAAGHAVVEAPAAPGSKRDLSTDAARLDDVPEAGARPPITDLVAVRRLLAEIRGFIATFPPHMQEALDLWLHDHSFDEIAGRLSLGGADRARALVRAGHARLRQRFRERLPAPFTAAA